MNAFNSRQGYKHLQKIRNQESERKNKQKKYRNTNTTLKAKLNELNGLKKQQNEIYPYIYSKNKTRRANEKNIERLAGNKYVKSTWTSGKTNRRTRSLSSKYNNIRTKINSLNAEIRNYLNTLSL